MPQADAGGSSDMSASYYVNDLARSITQDGTTQTLELDPLQRMATKTKTGATSSTETYAYDGDSDSPAWTQTGSTWTRFAAGVGGDMEATQPSSGSVKVAINNLRGDTVAEATATGLADVRRVDEFGVVTGGVPSSRRYGFHGSKQRETLTSSGTIAMGVRLYVPRVGRFLQVDPVVGGTANPYEYPSDPINNTDLDGKAKKCKKKAKSASSGADICQKGACLLKHGPGTCKRALRLAKMADRATRRLFNIPKNEKLSNYDGTVVNAFRHCYWSGLMTRRLGSETAKSIGDIHEKYGENDDANRKMDEFNNAWGRYYGDTASTQSATRGKCYDAAIEGTLMVVR